MKHIVPALIGILAILAPTAFAQDARSFNANLYYRDSWDYTPPRYGVYAFPAVASAPVSPRSVKENAILCGNAGAVFAEGKYFVASAEEVNAPNGGYVVMSMHFYLFDTENGWECREIPDADEEFKAMDMAYNPVDGKVYGCFVKRGADGYYYFGTLDVDTGRVVMIRNYGQSRESAFTGIAISGEGTIYGINADGGLYSINPLTGEPGLIAETGLQDQYTTSAAYDDESGKIYYALNSDALNGIYTINPVTGFSQRLYSFSDGESLAGMYFPDAEPNPEAPGPVSDFAAVFSDGSLDGSVEFTAPSKTREGTPLSGFMEYVLTVNGQTMEEGYAEAASRKSIPLSLPCDGEYFFTIAFSNQFGQGTTSRLKTYVGHDIPSPPANVSLASDGSNFNIVWEPSTAVHGGYLSPELLSYRLVRYPDMAETTVSGTQTSLSLPLPQVDTRTHFHYTVASVYRDFISDALASPTLSIGSYNPPFIEDFEQQSTMTDFLNIDGDANGNAWIWTSGQLHSSICLESSVDDRLVTPPVKLQSGKSYMVSVDAKATRSPIRVYPEKLAISAIGGQREEEFVVLEPTLVDWDDYRTLTAIFTPASDGEYRFSINACSDADMYWLWIDNFQVGASFVSDVPAPVGNLTVTPDEEGGLSAVLDFILPETSVSGQPLPGIDSVVIYRDGVSVATLHGSPGESLTWTDTGMSNGSHEYEVAVVSGVGESPRVSCRVYVGIYQPLSVESPQAVYGADSGEVILSWIPPLYDAEGRRLPEESTLYEITRFDREMTVVGESVAGNSYAERVCAASSPQEFVQYEIVAVGAGGRSEPAYTNILTVGALIPTPAVESFIDGTTEYEFVIERDSDDASWTVTNDASNPGVVSSDGDGGLLRFTGVDRGDRADFHSGTFDISTLENPALCFDFLYPKGVESGLSLTVEWEDDGLLKSESMAVVPDPRIDGWQRFIYPVDMATGYLRFYLTGVNDTDSGVHIFVDNITLSALPTPNVGMVRFDVPPIVCPDEPFLVSALVRNLGLGDVEATVSLFKNDEFVESRQIVLEQGEKCFVDFEQQLPMILPSAARYYALVQASGDRVEEDNISPTAEVVARFGYLPAPRNVVARSFQDYVSVSWEEPDLGPENPTEITDGAEDYRPFSISSDLTELYDDYMGMWRSYDRDGCYTIGVGHGYETIPNATEKKGFMTFSFPESGMSSEDFRPATGDMMFASFASVAEEPGFGNDDWLVSPRLSGESQTVRFKARSCTDLYGLEHLEVLSTVGASPENFDSYISLLDDPQVPAYWKTYSVAIPGGTNYFAIRCKSVDMFALFVDDISFTPKPLHQTGLKVTGYSLWRDGILAASLDSQCRSYTEPLPADGEKPAYRLTANYGDSESRPSAIATLDDFSFVQSPDASGTPTFRYFTLQGILLKDKPSVSGIYLRQSGGKTERIIIN